MKRRTLLLGLAAQPLWLPTLSAAVTGDSTKDTVTNSRTRRVYSLDFDWLFHLGDLGDAWRPEFDDRDWGTVQLPHDWGIRLPFLAEIKDAPGDFSQKGIGWYRRVLDLPAGFDGRLLLDFDGVYQNSKIWFNGVLVGSRAYGFVPFQIDLTDSALPGERNVLAVRVDNETGPKARWYSGSGINRHVVLSVVSPVRIAPNGIRVTTKSLSAGFAEIRIEIDLLNQSNVEVSALATSRVDSPDGLNEAISSVAGTAAPGEVATIVQDLVLRQPAVWSPDTPNLYHMRVELRMGDDVIDDEVIDFGVRIIQWHPDFGFLINGRTTKLRGVCLHLDCGPVGSAVPAQTFERRLRILKELGCNAVRVAHHPAPVEFLNLCDKLGLFVISEAFDKWNLGFAQGFEHPNFTLDWERDLSAMLDRDRNHPSIIAWSVGNEAGMPGSDDHDSTLEMLANYVKKHEPTRPVTCAFLGNVEGTQETNVGQILKAGQPLDFFSLNYLERYFPLLRQANDKALIVATESYPFFRSIFGGVDASNSWYEVTVHQWVAGGFVWTGFDYFGESAGWPSRGWPNALIDACGFPKPQSLFHKTVWSSTPTVSIYVLDPDAPQDPGLDYWRSPPSVTHWNLKIDTVYAVQTPSNAESVELFVDGVSLGRQTVANTANQTIVWFVRHKRGTLRAVARNGETVVAEAMLASAGDAAAIRVAMDRPTLRANGQDVCHLEVSLVDSNGVLVPDADRQIRMGLAGPATLLGMDNGDLRSPESYFEGNRTTRGGKCLAIVQAWRQEGQVLLWFDANQVPSTPVTIEVKASGNDFVPFPPASARP